MILFEADWLKERAIVHTDTRNYDFIKMHILLKRMGIQNNKFFLALYNPELAKYDPHNLKDPSIELRQLIALECKQNFWYYVRECVRVSQQGGPPTQYQLNRANLAMTWIILCCIDVFLTIPRQIGKTVGAIVYFSWLMYLAAINIRLGIFARDSTLVIENIQRLKDIRDSLPDYLVWQTPADTNNKEGVGYKQFNNFTKTFVPQKDRIQAEGQGRGESFIAELWDEMGYYINNFISYQVATSSSSTAQLQAQALGVPCSNIITTTAAKKTSAAGAYAFGIKSQCMRFNEQLYDCTNVTDLRNMVKDNSGNRMVYIEYSWQQLGKTREWFETVTRGKSKDVIERDYLNIWQDGDETSVLDKETLDRIAEALKVAAENDMPITATRFETLQIRWYVHPDKIKQKPHCDRPFIIGCDTSDNVGRDFTTLVIIDPADLSLVAVCRCNVSNLAHVSKLVVQLLQDFPRSIFIPERNKNGAFLLDMIILALQGKGIDPFRRLYNTYVQDYSESSERFSNLDLGSGLVRKHFGFTTVGNTREMLYNTVLTTLMKIMADRIYDKDLADEARGLVIINGRIDHPDGGHDDTLISLLLAGFLVLFGRNLYLYGIRKEEFLSNIDDDGEETTAQDKEQQQAQRKRIQELESLISNTTNTTIRLAYERELNRLKAVTKEVPIDDRVVSMEQLDNEIQEDTTEIFQFKNPANVESFFNALF